MFRRITTLACAALAGATFLGLSAGTANAQATCPDVHWIGAAGSGERVSTDLTAYSGMGRVVYQSLRELSTEVQKDGRTLTAEAIDYPAVAAPGEDGVGPEPEEVVPTPADEVHGEGVADLEGVASSPADESLEAREA